MSIVRYATVTNTTGAALTSALVTQGVDYTEKVIVRTLAAADIGAGAGQTQNASGALAVQFNGAVIKDVISLEVFRTNSPIAANNQIDYIVSPDGKSLYIHDGGGIDLAAGDIVKFVILTGNQ